VETVMSLQKHIPFLFSPWFTPLALLLGFVFFWFYARGVVKWILCAVVAGFVAAIIYALLWLRFYTPPVPADPSPLPLPSNYSDICVPKSKERTRTSPIVPITKIEQHSSGPNSPNIVGNQNAVTINPDSSPNAYVESYDFNGARRISGPGEMRVDDAEIPSYEKMMELQSQRRWDKLLELCEEKMKDVPKWLTPYLFAAAAHMNKGEFSDAIPLLEHVQSEAPNNPHYAIAQKLLEQAKARPR
jgi:hypothetical protein